MTEHDFMCPACLFCVVCGISMRELESEYRPCPGGTGVGHCHLAPEPPSAPYTPWWAVPLRRPEAQ